MIQPIPFHDFGGDGPLLHFAHANGFPPACFRQMIEPLLPHYRVVGVYHRPLWPGAQLDEVDDWRVIGEDLIRFFDQQGWRGVVGVGHSLGAVATMLAALARPRLFRALVLIEPVFLPPHVLQALAANPKLLDSIPLIRNTRNRRSRWPDRQAAFTHFRKKSQFERWSDEALWDYVTHALHEETTGKVALTYRREWEAHIYTLPPHDVWQVVPNLSQPTLAIRGAESDTLFPEAWQLWQALQPQATFVEAPQAGHMVVMERPLRLAQIILNFLQEIVSSQYFGGNEA